MKLSRTQIKQISRAIDELFGGVKLNLLGRFFSGSKILFEVTEVNPEETLEGIFRYTMGLGHPGLEFNDQLVRTLSEVAGGYIDAERLKTKNRVLAAIKQAEDPKAVDKLVADSFESTTKYLKMLVGNEIRTTQVAAEDDAIKQVAASIGDDDPTVVVLGVVDEKLCKYCRKMYHDPKNPWRPVPYKMSELRSGYFKAKEWDGKSAHMPPLHPNCRHSLSYNPPNMGVDNTGRPIFVSHGYDYYNDYHGIKVQKTEDLTQFDGLEEYLKNSEELDDDPNI